MYRKQVRRRRAVLALLIVGSFALLTVTYGQGSDGMQRFLDQYTARHRSSATADSSN